MTGFLRRKNADDDRASKFSWVLPQLGLTVLAWLAVTHLDSCHELSSLPVDLWITLNCSLLFSPGKCGQTQNTQVGSAALSSELLWTFVDTEDCVLASLVSLLWMALMGFPGLGLAGATVTCLSKCRRAQVQPNC